jgi:hypothetical protein
MKIPARGSCTTTTLPTTGSLTTVDVRAKPCGGAAEGVELWLLAPEHAVRAPKRTPVETADTATRVIVSRAPLLT